MGKRSSFERRERDFYPTPRAAVLPLLRELSGGTRFIEPCVGDGALVEHLENEGFVCCGAYDVERRPTRSGYFVVERDARSSRYRGVGEVDCFITNPPWNREDLHAIIANLAHQAPTWLLFDADWPHTKQAAPYLPMLRKIVSVGRVKWIPDSKMTGKDNCCWYLFDAANDSPAVFYGRAA